MLIASPNFEKIFAYTNKFKNYTELNKIIKMNEFWILYDWGEKEPLSLRYIINKKARLFNDEENIYQTYEMFMETGEQLTEEEFIEEANKLIKGSKFDNDMKVFLE